MKTDKPVPKRATLLEPPIFETRTYVMNPPIATATKPRALMTNSITPGETFEGPSGDTTVEMSRK